MSRSGYGHPSQTNHSQSRSGSGHRQGRTRIVEVSEDEARGAQQVRTQPIVEEPDDEPTQNHHQYQQQHQQQTPYHHRSASNGPANPYRQQQQQQQQYNSGLPRHHQRPRTILDDMLGDMGMFGFGGFGGFGHSMMNEMLSSPAGFGSGASFSSVSYSSSSGSGPSMQYSTSKTMRMGPGGVAEIHETVKDSRTGTEKVTVQRTLGDKSYVVTKERDRHGSERTQRRLENMTEAEAQQFDQRWQTAASQSHVPRIHSSSNQHQSPANYIEYHNSPSQKRR